MRSKQLRKYGCDDTENDRTVLSPSKKVDVDLEPGREHQHQLPEVCEELLDWLGRPGDAENMRPQKDAEGQQQNEFRNSEAARKRRRADDDGDDDRELCHTRQGQQVRPKRIKPLHRDLPLLR